MLLFAHTGITLGAAFAIDRLRNTGLFWKKQSTETIGAKENPPAEGINPAEGYEPAVAKKQLSSPIKIDYRFILIGSMLPDIIDKPLGNLILRDSISNGRIFSHTLLFLLLILIAGILVRHFYRKDFMFFLAFGVAMHFILDSLWQIPVTLFWPAFGLIFPKYDVENWLASLLNNFLSDPATFVPEMIGLAMVIYVSIELLLKRSVWRFLKTGNLWKQS